MVVEDRPRASARAGCVDALEHVGNQPIAEHVLDTLESTGIEEVIVASSVGVAAEIRTCLSAHDERRDLRLRFVEGRGPTDVVAALRLVAPVVGDAPCLVHVASGLLGESLTPLLDSRQVDSPDVTLMVHHGASPDAHLSPAAQDMLRIAELHPSRAALRMTGVWLFGPGAVHHVSDAPWRSGGDANLTTVAERIAAAGGAFHLRLVDAWRNYAGNPLDLLELNHLVLDRMEAESRPPESNGNQIEGRVRIHRRASVRNSLIVGPTVIGAEARIADAYIGPYTSIGAGARIEGAEIERSIIAAGASVMHIGGRLVASVVGRDARIFRDFSLPRALRLRVGDGTEVALC